MGSRSIGYSNNKKKSDTFFLIQWLILVINSFMCMSDIVLDTGCMAVNKTKNLSLWTLQLAGGPQTTNKYVVTDKCCEEKEAEQRDREC